MLELLFDIIRPSSIFSSYYPHSYTRVSRYRRTGIAATGIFTMSYLFLFGHAADTREGTI
jgi:hypothetical protein